MAILKSPIEINEAIMIKDLILGIDWLLVRATVGIVCVSWTLVWLIFRIVMTVVSLILLILELLPWIWKEIKYMVRRD